jgi:hypothetical protein
MNFAAFLTVAIAAIATAHAIPADLAKVSISSLDDYDQIDIYNYSAPMDLPSSAFTLTSTLAKRSPGTTTFAPTLPLHSRTASPASILLVIPAPSSGEPLVCLTVACYLILSNRDVTCQTLGPPNPIQIHAPTPNLVALGFNDIASSFVCHT